MNLRIGHIEIFVKDPLKSKDFYVNILGFEHIVTQGEEVVWLKLGDQEVLLRPGDNSNSSGTYQSARIGIVIYSDDADKTLAIYKERGLAIKGDDTGCPIFTDPDGNWFQLVNPSHQ